MKRIACALYGQPRFVNEGHRCITKMLTLENFEVDYYCHSYQGSKKYDSSPWSDGDESKVLLNTKQHLNKLYNPIKIIVTSPYNKDDGWIQNSLIGKSTYNLDKQTDGEVNDFENIPNILSQIYSRAIVAKMIRESEIDYDFIVTTRYDFRVPFDTSFFNKIDNTKIYTNNGFGLINDNFLIMGKQNFVKVTNIYGNLKNIINNKKLKKIAEIYGINYEFVIEDLIALNILYHNKTLDNLVRTSKIGDIFRYDL